MKEVKAYVHRTRIADVIAALKDCPCWRESQAARRHNLALYVVKGSLKPLDNEELHYSLDIGDEIVNEYKLELICADDEVDEIINALQTAGRTGQPVAGWITVTQLDRAIPIE
ncbi:MAG: hypothetical protein KF822_13050 [Steroidobacteraceae bacterium]|jgi:nitrogen regulatory protein P-II 1|nr:hypothetical protein [Steroidobacteraceae bacterium]